MNELIEKLNELLKRLENSKGWDVELLIDVKNKLRLYVSKFFANRQEYGKLIEKVNTSPTQDWEFSESKIALKSIVTTLIEDTQLSGNNNAIQTEEERQKILAEARKEAEIEREKMKAETREIERLREQLQFEKSRITEEEKKFNTFKTKLEVADKELDFQQLAFKNRKAAYFWAVIACILICGLIGLLLDNLSVIDTFIKMADLVKKGLAGVSPSNNDEIISKTIYFTFFKYIFTKLLLYSMFIYIIIFCVKNYNAQMHNNIINSLKSNAFKSTLSLINTARTDDGNDKLLIQATQAIFSNQPTGYNGKESEPNSPNLVTNIIDSAAKKA